MSIGLNREKVKLVEYDPNWAALYLGEARFLKELIGNEILTIDHIGSTSIVGMKAKPVIDLLIQISTDYLSKEAEKKLLDKGYAKTNFERRKEPMYSRMLPDNVATHNIHVAKKGSILSNALINFRDALREDPHLVERYEKLKLGLETSCANNRKAYYDAKIDFFESVVGKYFDPPKK